MLTLLNFAQLVQQMAGIAQGSCITLLDFAVGSPLRAIMEAQAGVALWVQWLILIVLTRTRLASSMGTDADTWVAQFGLTRLPAVAATLAVTFSRTSTTNPATIAVGAQVKSSDYTQTFVVIADATNLLWDIPSGSFIVPIGTASATVTVQNIVAGSAGNVLAGLITVIASTIDWLDYVTNGLASTNGMDAESDAALKARFTLYMNTRSKGTGDAMQLAIESVSQLLTATVYNNVPRLGAVTILVDDGTGGPPQGLLDAAQIAADAVAAATIQVIIARPVIVIVEVAMTVVLAPGTQASTSLAAATLALLGYINTLPVGTALGYLTLSAIAINATPGITGIVAATYLINGVAGVDVNPGPTGVVKGTFASVVVSGA